MKAVEKSHPFRGQNTSVHLSQSEKDNLGGFFKLLLTIDKRNNPGLYESNKDRNHSYTPEGGPDGFRIGRD